MRTAVYGSWVLTLSLLTSATPMALADQAGDRSAIESAAQAWASALNARDVDAMLALATDDIIVLDPGAAPASGREAVRAAWRQAASSASTPIAVVNKEIVVAGDFAWRIGAAAYKPSHGTAVNRGLVLEIWKRGDDGWKLHRRMSSGEWATSPGIQPRPVPTGPVLDKPGT